MTARRWAAWLAGMWAGASWSIALIGAPAAFALTDSSTAGRIAGRMFAQEAYLCVGLSLILFLVLWREARAQSQAGVGSIFTGDMLLALGALFCTIAGYFALQPMMAAARAGQGGVSFATLHGASGSLYALKALLVSALAWRLAAP